MENPHIVREKALRLAVRTGISPDLDFVWRWQRLQGCAPCFGSFTESCPAGCLWHERCRALSAEPLNGPWPAEANNNDWILSRKRSSGPAERV